MNPLLSPFKTVFETAPFLQIKNEHFEPAILGAISKAKEEIHKITSSKEKPTFKNTIEALEFSGMHLKRVTSIFFNLNSAETSDEIQTIAQKVSPLLTEFANDIRLNKELFEQVKSIHNRKESLNLSPEQNTLITSQYKMFVRNGANLNEKEQQELRSIDKKLSKLSLQFGENILAETNAFELYITDKNKLGGLPEGTVEAAKLTAQQKDKEGWVFTLDYPSYVPFMTYADNRTLRKEMALAFGARAFQGNQNDNQQIVLDIVSLRFKRANLLGYKTHSDFILEERMAETPSKVINFSNDLLSKAKPAALKEFKQLEDFAKKQGLDQLQKWDGAYYSEKLKKELFNFDEEQLKPYFKLENVLDGVFQIANKLYDLNFELINNIETYHKDVQTFKVTNNTGDFIAVFYADFFPREGKRNGAWMTSFKDQWKRDNNNSRPHISIVCNFTKPTDTKPSLLTFNEATTLFHEFGHALHGILADTTYPSISGTSVHWDFVELPSQILENWCYEKEALDLFAKHFETNEPIPMDLVKKIKESAAFLEGIATMRQLSFGILDMSWHSENAPELIQNVKDFENQCFLETQLYPNEKSNCMSTAFSHIFQGGYSSGYYSYKWAEVLDADAFEYFKSEGIFNKEVALKFKENILSKGGTENPMTLYKRFRGKEPNAAALIKRAGLS
jgi:oligopeptidase A